MPRNINYVVPDPTDTRDGVQLTYERLPGVAGAAGARISFTNPGDPGGAEVMLGTDFTAAERATIKAAVDVVIAKMKARRGY